MWLKQVLHRKADCGYAHEFGSGKCPSNNTLCFTAGLDFGKMPAFFLKWEQQRDTCWIQRIKQQMRKNADEEELSPHKAALIAVESGPEPV